MVSCLALEHVDLLLAAFWLENMKKKIYLLAILKESESNDILIHFEESFNVHNSDISFYLNFFIRCKAYKNKIDLRAALLKT